MTYCRVWDTEERLHSHGIDPADTPAYGRPQPDSNLGTAPATDEQLTATQNAGQREAPSAPGKENVKLMTSSWSSLQIATLVVNTLTPLTVAGLGVFIAKASRRIEQVQWANQTVVSRRLDIFAQLAPGLNQLLCFATFVGGWKEIQPRQAIATKRKLDETMYANKLLFSDRLFAAYHQFMATLFDMYAATDADAPLRASITHILGDRRNMPWWEASMASLFSSEGAISIEDIQAAHDHLEQQFRAELYVTRQTRPLLNSQA